jgi:hypothetical protein
VWRRGCTAKLRSEIGPAEEAKRSERVGRWLF